MCDTKIILYNNEMADVKAQTKQERYAEKLYRSAFAIRKELEPALKDVVEKSGAPSVSGMLTLMARAPEECAALLKPVFERMNESENLRKRSRVSLKSIVDGVKSGEVSTDELAAALALIKGQRAAGEPGPA